jgi:hypothetical protein
MIRQSVSGLDRALFNIWSAISGQTKSFVRQNRAPLLPIALLPESRCRAVVFPTTIKPDAMCVRRMGRLLNQVARSMPWNGKFDQPIDQTNGGTPPAAARISTAMRRPQPAARPSSNPSSTLAQAGW